MSGIEFSRKDLNGLHDLFSLMRAISRTTLPLESRQKVIGPFPLRVDTTEASWTSRAMGRLSYNTADALRSVVSITSELLWDHARFMQQVEKTHSKTWRTKA